MQEQALVSVLIKTCDDLAWVAILQNVWSLTFIYIGAINKRTVSLKTLSD